MEQLDGKSRMRRESHVRFCEGPGVQFPRATRHRIRLLLLDLTGMCDSRISRSEIPLAIRDPAW